MLHVVQTSAWDWAPPHMSGYPHLPAPPPQYQQSYDEDPQWPSYAPLPRGPPPHGEPPRGHPPPLPYGAPPRGHPRPLPYGAPPRGPPPPLPYGAPPGASGEPPELRPKALLGPFTNVAESKKVRGRLRNQPDRTSSVAPQMRGLYGAVSHMFVEPRSRLPDVLPLGCPPRVSTGSAGDGRDAGRSPEHQNRRICRRWDGGGAGCCAACSPRVLLCRL